jgi:hypothetical protein
MAIIATADTTIAVRVRFLFLIVANNLLCGFISVGISDIFVFLRRKNKRQNRAIRVEMLLQVWFDPPLFFPNIINVQGAATGAV